MVVVFSLGLILALIANERWRWGYPRPVRYDSKTAASWLATVIRSDFRMYEGEGVQSLMNEVVSSGLFLGKSRAEIEDLLGPPDSTEPGPRRSTSVLRYDLGTIPPTIRAGPPTLFFDFDDSGRCREVVPFMSY